MIKLRTAVVFIAGEEQLAIQPDLPAVFAADADLRGAVLGADEIGGIDDEGGSIEATVDLAEGASGVLLTVFDDKGSPVQELSTGAQDPGVVPLIWDGLDSMGNPAPAGLYRLKAQAVVNGKTTDVTVNTLSTVRSIKTNPADGSVSLEVDGGKSILLTNVQRVGS